MFKLLAFVVVTALSVFFSTAGRAEGWEAYQFVCSPEIGRFEVREIYIDEPKADEAEAYINQLAQKDIQVMRPKIEYAVDEASGRAYAANDGEPLQPKTCTIHDHTFTVEAFALHNFTVEGRQCSEQGPSLRVTVKDGEQTVIDEIRFVNGCFERYEIKGLTYTPAIKQGEGSVHVDVTDTTYSLSPYFSIGSEKWDIPVLTQDSMYKEFRRLRLIRLDYLTSDPDYNWDIEAIKTDDYWKKEVQ